MRGEGGGESVRLRVAHRTNPFIEVSCFFFLNLRKFIRKKLLIKKNPLEQCSLWYHKSRERITNLISENTNFENVSVSSACLQRYCNRIFFFSFRYFYGVSRSMSDISANERMSIPKLRNML